MNRLSFHARYGVLLVVVGLVCSVGMFALTRHGGFAALVCVVLGLIQVLVPLVVLEPDHFLSRPAVLGSARRILYRDMRRIVVEDGKLLVHVVAAAGETCAIRLAAFSPDAREAIERELGQRMRAATR